MEHECDIYTPNIIAVLSKQVILINS